ncbi:uncharacterized protein LOC128991775 isoform X2 [Macrosteles quadrilineatus]|uniref:uncharacterized protein LOC128991775 isoform X2 n=1 Tax=Macrosteles quadrilineatus TaxID=74068 RepID=UPI0023E26E35|nr:uncharacterized protein LOC128991775 isoform X2 [Macrosteles quadrilineatus]
METDQPNPFTLTLDEIIVLNKKRNSEAEEKKALAFTINSRTQSRAGSVINEDPPSVSPIKRHRLIKKDLMSQRRPVHDRLGWKKKGNFQNNNSNSMAPPLTTRVLKRHNETNGNFTVKRIKKSPSVSSFSVRSSRPQLKRHSLKGELDPEIQDLLARMAESGDQPLLKTRTEIFVDDLKSLSQFRVTPVATSIPTFARFMMNDD